MESVLKKQNRIVIYGGSFNPPHIGHSHAARAAADALQPDKMLILPSGISPNKNAAASAISDRDRLAMCRIAFSGVPNAEICELEIRRGGISYTADTIHEIRRLYPEGELFLVIGSDMLQCFSRWYRSDFIAKECTLVPVLRGSEDRASALNAAEALRKQFGAEIRFLRCDPLPAASSDIRTELIFGKKPELLSEEVYQYITEHNLYTGNQI